jgi:hypothetical protein
MQLNELIGKEFYFVHKGTWENDYQWRIEKVKLRGVKINEKGELFVEFGFDCIGYEYPFSYLKKTMKDAKSFALAQINIEKEKQIALIKAIPDKK